MSDPLRLDVREEIDDLEGFLRGLLIGQDRLRDAMVERVAEFRAALTTPAPDHLTRRELELLPRMRLDLDRFAAFRADDVRALLDIIDRLDRVIRGIPQPMEAPHD